MFSVVPRNVNYFVAEAYASPHHHMRIIVM